MKNIVFQAILFSQAVLIQLIQFSINTDFAYTQLNVKTVDIKQISFVHVQFQCQKTVPFQRIQFSISTKFKCKYGLIVKNISISSYLVYSKNSF